ncbi:unnamed protein product [Spirodela intermedia]|uniref:Amidase domain-containing protein n=1 Tax=Spirodela intermedia TaxID=51605 RepID=A0A7I8I7L6_SPIIN|nr:unnamed protein product [Spirodela intermedia]CAA6653529.1 unnamed protein product [Spirodela intermedia]
MAVPISAPRFLLLQVLLLIGGAAVVRGFEISEATIEGIHLAFSRNELTSRRLVEFYLDRIRTLNPRLRAVIEVNPAALSEADRADEKRRCLVYGDLGALHGIPVLLKDNIATASPLNTTAGSLALVGATSARDAGVVTRLRRAGAVILGKASMSEWAGFRSSSGLNPYNPSATPCGSSSGSAISVAANMVTVSLGTETDGSIICPAASQALVGIKPTVGLTSLAGVVPISPRQDTVGPIGRTVADAVRVLEVIAGYDPRDSMATAKASEFIPPGGYRQFLREDGLRGKRLGILRRPFFAFPNGSVLADDFQAHLRTLREKGAIVVDDLEIADTSTILNPTESGEEALLLAEFKLSLNAYLAELPCSPVRSLADVIAFNAANPAEERLEEFGQDILLMSQATTGIGPAERQALARLEELSEAGLERLMREERLDAVVTPEATVPTRIYPVLAIGGYPGIVVSAGFDGEGVPFGICFGGLRGSDLA